MKICFRYEMADGVIERRWIDKGEATVKQQDFTVDPVDLTTVARQLIAELGFNFAEQNTSPTRFFHMKHGHQRGPFGVINTGFVKYIQLESEIANIDELLNALAALKALRDTETWQIEEEKRRATEKKAAEQRKVDANNEQRRQRIQEEAEAKVKAEDARDEWVADKGSEHLKLLWAQRKRFDTAYHRYEQERAALEYPGTFVDINNNIEANKMDNPSVQALRYFTHGLTDEVRALSHIVNIWADHSGGIEYWGGEAVEINDPNYIFRLYYKVSHEPLPPDNQAT